MNAPFATFEDAPGTNAAEFTVSELSQALKRAVEDGFGHVRVRGEIGNFRGRHGSGHAYFALKDADACLDAVVWRSAWARLGVKPEEGLEVIATGRLSTFAKKSSYQLVVDQLEPAGIGALMKLLEERRQRLAAEGLFDEARRRPLPLMPRVVGVVTSPTGAVIRDILHRIADRFPTHVIVWPVRVQGETCAAEVAAAVTGFAGDYGGPRPDVIVVARGGGSVEDLWGYNDEALVRAVAASPIPIVSAVGHETDWTLIDHAADHRAPTPTGAAERIVPVRVDCLATLDDRVHRLATAATTLLRRHADQLRYLGRGLPTGVVLLQPLRQRLDLSGDRLVGALTGATAHARRRHLSVAGRLSPAIAHRPLERATSRLAEAGRRLGRVAEGTLAERRAGAARVAARLSPHLLTRPLAEARGSLVTLAARRDRAMAVALSAAVTRVAASAKLLSAVSYQAVLERGFALVRRASDEPVRAAADVAPGEALQIEFADGRVRVAEASAPARPAAAATRSPRRSRKVDDAQGLLL
ncbi:exodeoxyribonuclease VII large subunit [Acuticoccus sp.]|uniref:exodeoxyribonuclease VII large subunit n=1 Tax=Acuticoccus sp. TaxID=1904378 RepID=UPI003B51E102